jgi:methionyl-tRNA synthetase
VADKGAAEPVDDDLKAFVTAAYDKVEAKMDELRAADALTEIFAVFKRLNKYIDETEPWVLARDEAKADRLSTVLYNLIEGITIGTALMAPFMPETADKIVKMLNTEIRDFDTLGTFGLYPSGNKVTDNPEILFARLKEADVMKEVDKIMAKQRKEAEKQAKLEEKAKEKVAKDEEKASEDADKAAGAASEQAENTAEAVVKKPEITIDDFAKMEFKVGEVIACEEVKKSKKLLCSKVKIGDEVRQIVSGIRKYYTAEEMVGKKVMVITNLKPAKLAGIMSEGMLLCAEGPDGTLALMTPEADKNIPDGAEIG